MTRIAPFLLASILAACGSDGGKSTDPAGTGTPSGGSSCSPAGTLDGCLVYNSADCVNDTSLDGLDGGWFNDQGGKLVIGLAPSRDGVNIKFTVDDATGLASGSEWEMPNDVLTEITDADGTLYYACVGTVRVTSYTAGQLLWAMISGQARGPMGNCNDTDYFTFSAELINAEFCADG